MRQDRIGSSPILVLGSIQRNSGVLKGGEQLAEVGGVTEAWALRDRQVCVYLRKAEGVSCPGPATGHYSLAQPYTLSPSSVQERM